MQDRSAKEIALSVLGAIFSAGDVKRLSKLRGVILCGYPGCGKSTIANLLEDAFGFERLSTDGIRVKELGQKHRMASEHTKVMISRYMVYAELAKRVNKRLNDKGKVVVDGTHLDEKRFNILGAMLSKVPSSKMAMIVVRTPEWIIKQRFRNAGKKEYEAWWSVYSFWKDYVRRGQAQFPKRKELSNVQIIKPKRYAIRTFEWIPDIKAIGWDLDGTLYPSKLIPKKLFTSRQVKALMEKNNWTRARAKREYAREYGRLGSHTKALSNLGVNGVDFFVNLWDELELEKYLQPDIKLRKMFLKLKHLRHFIITNAGRIDQVERKLRCLGLKSKMFEFIIPAYELKAPKPQLKSFKQAEKELKLEPSQILYVGDRVHPDILPAKKVGMKAALVYGVSQEADVSLKNAYEVAGLFGKEI